MHSPVRHGGLCLQARVGRELGRLAQIDSLLLRGLATPKGGVRMPLHSKRTADARRLDRRERARASVAAERAMQRDQRRVKSSRQSKQ